MAKGSKPQRLGDVVQRVIDRMGIRRELDEARVIEAWASIAGERVNARTASAWVKGATLYVQLNSSTWRQELHLRRRQWVRRLNEELGEDLVEEIVFR